MRWDVLRRPEPTMGRVQSALFLDPSPSQRERHESTYKSPWTDESWST